MNLKGIRHQHFGALPSPSQLHTTTFFLLCVWSISDPLRGSMSAIKILATDDMVERTEVGLRPPKTVPVHSTP